MLSDRPRELRLVIQYHEAAMMTNSCTRLFFLFMSSVQYDILGGRCVFSLGKNN